MISGGNQRGAASDWRKCNAIASHSATAHKTTRFMLMARDSFAKKTNERGHEQGKALTNVAREGGERSKNARAREEGREGRSRSDRAWSCRNDSGLVAKCQSGRCYPMRDYSSLRTNPARSFTRRHRVPPRHFISVPEGEHVPRQVCCFSAKNADIKRRRSAG